MFYKVAVLLLMSKILKNSCEVVGDGGEIMVGHGWWQIVSMGSLARNGLIKSVVAWLTIKK